MTDRYCQVNAEIVLHVKRRTIEGERRDLCAVYHGTDVENWHHGLTWDQATDVAELPLNRLGDAHLEQPVLVRIVEVAEDSKEWREFWVRSVVRLQSLDLCPHSLAEALDAPLLAPEAIGRVRDGKSEDPFIGGRILIRFDDSDAIDGVVEGGPKIMDAVAGEERPPFQGRLLIDVYDDAIPGCVRVSLSDDAIRATVSPGRNLVFDGLQVFLSPADLGPRTG